jgi:hypothetical protein
VASNGYASQKLVQTRIYESSLLIRIPDPHFYGINKRFWFLVGYTHFEFIRILSAVLVSSILSPSALIRGGQKKPFDLYLENVLSKSRPCHPRFSLFPNPKARTTYLVVRCLPSFFRSRKTSVTMFDINSEASFDFFSHQSMLPIAARAYNSMICDHYMSYDRFSRPYKFYELSQVENPHTQFSSHAYYEMTWFWLEQLVEINQELTLIPDFIRCRRTGCFASKDLAIFLLLRRWHMPGNWSAVRRDLRWQCSWCIQIYHETFCLLAASYRICVRVFDYRWINPLLEEWGEKCHCIAVAMIT